MGWKGRGHGGHAGGGSVPCGDGRAGGSQIRPSQNNTLVQANEGLRKTPRGSAAVTPGARGSSADSSQIGKSKTGKHKGSRRGSQAATDDGQIKKRKSLKLPGESGKSNPASPLRHAQRLLRSPTIAGSKLGRKLAGKVRADASCSDPDRSKAGPLDGGLHADRGTEQRLPAGWERHWHERKEAYYYFNISMGASQWTFPGE